MKPNHNKKGENTDIHLEPSVNQKEKSVWASATSVFPPIFCKDIQNIFFFGWNNAYEFKIKENYS